MQPMQPFGIQRWEGGRDDVSFEDSERFEEDSQVSLDDSLDENQHNWRGWADCNGEAIQPRLSCVVYPYHNASGRFSSASTRTVVPGDPNNPLAHHPMMSRGDNPTGILLTLSEIAAKICAEKWSFQQLEDMYQHICVTRAMKMETPPPIGPIPEKIFVSFIVHCFPQATDEIRMYSCLANGSPDQYEYGKILYQYKCVHNVSQTGFLLSGDVHSNPPDAQYSDKEKEVCHVTVKVDRCRIVEITCECSIRSSWCKHVVALCIYRISERSKIKFKETIADAINSMSDKDLRKLVQWHINDIPRKCIPGFQKLIDQIKDKDSDINRLHGAPDPTDGGHEPVSRYDFPEIESKIRRLLIKYCVPAPAVHCDVQYLSSNQHPTHVEWTSRIKPLRSREPEGLWNLLQMVREMFARNDDNAVALLRTVTDECLSNSQVLLWWYITKLTHSANWTQTVCFKAPDSKFNAQIHCAQLCDEIVLLWRLVAMNPRAGKEYRSQLAVYLQSYHQTAVTRLKNAITSAPPITNEIIPTTDLTVLSNHKTASILQTVMNADIRYPLSAMNMKFTLNCFSGFYSAIQMCHYLNEQNIRFGVTQNAIFSISDPNMCTVYRMVPVLREKSLKKKKKRKKRVQKSVEVDGKRPEEIRGVDGVWRVVEEGPQTQAPLNDSTESGQESDVQRGATQVNKKKKPDNTEVEVNEVLAAAFQPLDTLEAKFLRVEAYGTHGYRADAVEHSLKVIEYLIDSLTEQALELQRFDEEGPSTSKQSTSSSSSSTTSEEVTAADRDEEVARGSRFLATMEKILYITKVLKDSPHLQHTVFDICLRTLEITKYPLFTPTHQMAFTYLENEFVTNMEQFWQSVEMTSSIVQRIREKAEKIVETDCGNNGELPPISLTKFLFLALYWTESLGAVRGQQAQNATTASPALQANRRLLLPTDSDLALHVSLHIIGCRPQFSERYNLHWETVRRQKSELTSILLVRYKDSQEKCALVLDQILDPKLHRMYQNHLSNAAYFLERCPEYTKRFKRGQRPVFPYKDEIAEAEAESPEDGYQAQIEALARLQVSSAVRPAAPINRKRSTDDGARSSSSSEFSVSKESSSQSGDSIDSPDPNVPGPSNQQPPKNNENHPNRRMKKRSCRSLSFDPGNTVTDAAVYHMQELSKKILIEAGGSQNNAMWGQHNLIGTNRRLHLCAIAISIYALGMHNRITPHWNTRTYSGISSWITTQIEDIGANVLEMIREIWMAHFTPSEICQCSDKIAPASDTTMKHEAARLALSVLPFAHALTDDEVIRALRKCHDDSREMVIMALVAIDTPQFQQVARSRCLWEIMMQWHNLNGDDRRDGQQMQQHQPPVGMIPNQFPAQVQQYQQPLQQQMNVPNRPPPHNPYNPPLQQVAMLYPPVHDRVGNRFPQSRSAPQLAANNDEGQQGQQQNPQFMVPPSVQGSALWNAWNYGMRAMECLVTSPGEDRQLYLKFTREPPYSAEVSSLYYFSKQLGIDRLRDFYRRAAATILSPYVLHHYAKESCKFFPYISHMYSQQYQRPVVPLMSSHFPPTNNYNNRNVRYSNVRYCNPGQIANQMIHHGYQDVTGELFERCIEQYLQGLINKMNSPHPTSGNDLCDFVRGAYEAFQYIPNMGRQGFEDFVRIFKRQKSYKKECQMAIQPLLNQLCISH